MSLGFELRTAWKRQDPGILIQSPKVVFLGKTMTVKGRASTRTRIKQARDFLRIWVMQVGEGCASAGHFARSELISKLCIRSIRQHVCERSDYRSSRHLCRTINRSCRKQVGLVVQVRAFLK